MKQALSFKAHIISYCKNYNPTNAMIQIRVNVIAFYMVYLQAVVIMAKYCFYYLTRICKNEKSMKRFCPIHITVYNMYNM